jgi:hypothetical protein
MAALVAVDCGGTRDKGDLHQTRSKKAIRDTVQCSDSSRPIWIFLRFEFAKEFASACAAAARSAAEGLHLLLLASRVLDTIKQQSFYYGWCKPKRNRKTQKKAESGKYGKVGGGMKKTGHLESSKRVLSGGRAKTCGAQRENEKERGERRRGEETGE